MSTVLTPTGSPSLFGGIGRLEFAPNNGPDDPFPTWVDITVFLRTETAALTITRGRQSELDTIQSSQLTAVLDNTDNRFTFGLTTGPYGAGWAPAKKVRYSETIGQRTFVLYTGWIEAPDIDDWQPIGYQEVSLSCTDRLTRLGRGRTFVSTLGEHIRFNGGSDLKAFWPFGDLGSSFPDIGPLAQPALPIAPVIHQPAFSAAELPYVPQGGTSIPADDLKPLLFRPVLLSPAVVGLAARIHTTALSIPVNSSTITVSWWMWWDDIHTDDVFPTAVTSTGIGSLSMFRTSGTWTMVGNAPASTVNVTLRTPPTQKWTLFALRMTLPTGLVELWVDQDPAQTGTMSGSPPSSLTFDDLTFGDDFAGALAYMQIYVGSRYTRAVHNAQAVMGFTGLEYQTTGQRINTILDYAGVPSTDRAVDLGVSYMQAALLAGQSPEDALENAVGTERGRGFASGDGRYVFHDRIRVLNV